MENHTQSPPTEGPWDFVTVSADRGTGFHLYLVDSTGRKIGVLWGKGKEKVANAEFIVNARNEHALRNS